MANLDQIDRLLLGTLQDEGRVTNVELASRVGLTAPPCLRRVRALEDSGVIRGYHAELDGAKLAHVTDTHTGRFVSGELLMNIARATNDLKADAIFFTGDLIDYSIAA